MVVKSSRFFSLVIVALLSAGGCGLDPTSAGPDTQTRIVTTIKGVDVVAGRVYTPTAAVTLNTVNICQGRADGRYITAAGDFAVQGVACNDGHVLATLSNGTALNSFLSGYPLASADIRLTSKDNWYGQTVDNVDVGGGVPVIVSELTDIAYKGGNKTVNDFLNRYAVDPAACGTTRDYTAAPRDAYLKIKGSVARLAALAPLADCSVQPPQDATFDTIVADLGADSVNDFLNAYFQTSTFYDYAANPQQTYQEITAAVNSLLLSPGPSDYKLHLGYASYSIGKKNLNNFLNGKFGPVGATYDYVGNPPTTVAVTAATEWLQAQ